jgi:hypothetical protein
MRIVERGDGWLRIGPLVLTTPRRHAARERNAFELGRDSVTEV